MSVYTQDERPIAIETPLGKDKLLLEAVNGSEEISRLFSFNLQLLSTEDSVDPKQLVGKSVSFRINQGNGQQRWFTGWVSRFIRVGRDDRLIRWRAELVPSLWFLTKTSDCKAWADKRVKLPDIVEEVLKEHPRVKLKKSLQGSYATREYCVQYRETDFNFVSRLMEHEGISYHFEHDRNNLTMVLADASSAYTDCKGEDIEFVDAFEGPEKPGQVFSWEQDWSYRSGKFTQRDYNYEMSTTDLLSKRNGTAEYEGASDLEIFDYPGEYDTKSDGNFNAQVRIEEEEVAASTVRGISSCRTFSPGFTFKAADGKKYLLTSVTHSASIVGAYQSDANEAQFDYKNSFTCVPAAVSYRPQRLTPKPTVSGSQTAVVVGRSGEEIDTDKYGRVKVQFHWDRYGQKNEKSSCWVRVAQAMAGPGWGGQFIPRVGQEVVVSFLEGDPDRPLVTGVVYNDQHKHPFSLPDNKTQSGFRSRSTKQAGDTNFNELRFEDKKGAEEIYIHAEKDCSRVVENNDVLEVGVGKQDEGNRTVTVFNDQSETIGCKDAKSGSRFVTVFNDQTEVIGSKDAKSGSRNITVFNNHSETIGCSQAKDGSRKVSVWKNDTTTIEQGDSAVEVKMGNRIIKIGMGKQSTEAMQSIEMKVGGSSIKVDQTGVAIKGMLVTIDGQIMTQVKAGAIATIDGGGMLKAKAGITMIG